MGKFFIGIEIMELQNGVCTPPPHQQPVFFVSETSTPSLDICHEKIIFQFIASVVITVRTWKQWGVWRKNKFQILRGVQFVLNLLILDGYEFRLRFACRHPVRRGKSVFKSIPSMHRYTVFESLSHLAKRSKDYPILPKDKIKTIN